MAEHLLCYEKDKRIIEEIKRKRKFKTTREATHYLVEKYLRDAFSPEKILASKVAELINDYGVDLDKYRKEVVDFFPGIIRSSPEKTPLIIESMLEIARNEVKKKKSELGTTQNDI